MWRIASTKACPLQSGVMCIIRPRSFWTAFIRRKHDGSNGMCTELRDGRQLKRERKPRNVMALSRFLQKKNGLYGQQESITLNELGMPELSPSHAHRPTELFRKQMLRNVLCTCDRQASDFVFRYWRRSATVVHQACRRDFVPTVHIQWCLYCRSWNECPYLRSQ